MASPSSTFNLRFPQMGVVRRHTLQNDGQQSEYGTPYALNVRLEDTLTNRLRGGSFVGKAIPLEQILIYRDRLIEFDNNAIQISRVGDHLDFASSSDLTDTTRPAVFQFSEAGQISGNIVAVVPHKDQNLLGFTANQTWVQQGDPLTGGRRRVSDQVGIVGKNAWCIAHDTIYFLSDRGLYSVAADGSGLSPISEDVIPQELIGLMGPHIFLDYDHATRGIYIHLPTQPSWFFDLARNGFWPFNNYVDQSHLLIGPLRIGQADQYGRILDLHGITADGSANVTWTIIPGKTAEQAASAGKIAIEASVAGEELDDDVVYHTGLWTAGRSHRSYPRTRAIWCCLWLSRTSLTKPTAWAYESIAMTRIVSGKWR